MIWEIDDGPRAIEGLDARGRPQPAYAASLGLRPARYGQRVLATLCEAAIMVVIALPALIVVVTAALAAVAASDPLQSLQQANLLLVVVCAAASSFLSTVFIVVQLVLHGRRGVTIGKAITGVRTVNVRTLERPGFWRGAVVRYLVLWASFVVPLIGPLLVVALSPLFDADRRGRGWPDLAAATWLVDVRRGLNPYDAKRMRIARKTAATQLRDVVPSLPSLATPKDAAAGVPVYPVARSTGGVLGAPRTDAGSPTPSAPPSLPVATGASAMPASPAPVAPAPPPAAPPPATPSPSGAAEAAAPAPAPAEAAAPAPAPAEAAASTPTPTPSPAGAVLVLDTGERIRLDDGVRIGRAPADADGLRAVALADDTMSVSKTHLAVRRSTEGWTAEDLHSTNGSGIVRGGAQLELVAGRPTPLRDGDEIRFGDRHARFGLS